MPTLLVLGSKPDPVLPPAAEFDAVACANASGYSADRHGLPVPALTAISAVVTSGIGSGKQSLEALHGLSTGALYLVPQFDKPRKLKKKIRTLPITIKTSPVFFRFRLKQAGYCWRSFICRDAAFYQELIGTLCRQDPQIMALVAEKKPSTGVITLMIGMSLGSYDRFVMSGFNFELTHAYADNPEIRQRGTTLSRHTPTDLQVLHRLVDIHGNLYTTEPTVNEQAGVPFLPPVAAATGGA
jgi:hypothetical protein